MKIRSCIFFALVTMLFISISASAIIRLGPVPDCDLAVLDGSYSVASTSHEPVNMLYVEILRGGSPTDSIKVGSKLWLNVPAIVSASSPVLIGHRLNGDLEGYCDDLGSGKSCWSFVNNHLTIIGDNGNLRPLAQNPPSNQNTVRFFCVLLWIGFIRWFYKRFRQRSIENEICLFVREFSLMADNGKSQSECLTALLNQSRSSVFRDVLIKIRDDIDSGLLLSAAIEKHRPPFSDGLICLIKDGETSGRLAQNLGAVAEIFASPRPFYSMTRSLQYPVFVLMIAVAVVIALLVFVIPQFKEAFSYLDLSTEMRILLWLSDTFVAWWYLVLTVFVGIVSLTVFVLDYSVGEVVRTSTISAFIHNVSILNSLGIPLVRTLEYSARNIGGTIPAELAAAESSVRQPEDDFQQRAEKLSQINKFCREEVDKALGRLNMVAEVFVILLMALMVGGIVLTVFRPTAGVFF